MAKFELTPVVNDSTGKYEIANFNEVLESARNYIKEHHFEKVESALEFKELKDARTEIRMRQDLIKEVRLQTSELLLGTFNEQAKTLEKMLGEEDAHLKALKEKWEAENGKVAKPKAYRLAIKTYDEKVFNKIKDMALKLGAEVEVK